MKRITLGLAASVVILANVFALAHAAHNRSGVPDADVTLTNRELPYLGGNERDNSGVSLNLQWTNPDFLWGDQLQDRPVWLDGKKLQTLGFDCGTDPKSPKAREFYARQLPRRVFIALEYDGSAWHSWLEAERNRVGQQNGNASPNSVTVRGEDSHLLPIDADRDPVKLRNAHPDRSKVIVLPGVVAITLNPYPFAGRSPDARHPVRIVGVIRQLPSSIHVPLPFSDELRRLKGMPFRVKLRYGADFEPWVTSVESIDLK